MCREIARSQDIVCSCLYGSRVCGYARQDSDYDVLLVLKDYFDGVRYHYRSLNNVYAVALTVDEELFKLDVAKGGLGEFVAGRLQLPYIPLINAEYLWKMELETKKRIVVEELEDLILEYGELSRGFVIEPEYFALARMRKRAKVYPPLRYSYVNMLTGALRESNMQRILNGYVRALDDLAKMGVLKFQDGKVTLKDAFIDKILSRKTVERVVNVVELSQRALRAYIAHGRAGQVDVNIVAKELASKIKRELQISLSKRELEDPKNYLFLKTAKGLVSLNEKASVVDVARKLRPGARIAVSPLAGVLNEVYLVTAGDEALVAKKFTDWHGVKWFTLNLVTLGTKLFSLSGKTRLANEYGVSNLLIENNISVPEIIHISLPERLIFKRYIKGTPVVEIVREAFMSDRLPEEKRQIAFDVGRVMANIHKLDIGIGDTKPENFIFGMDKKTYTVDLEQARRMGDKAWDIAEFLYYAGHYGIILTGGFQEFIDSFVKGYRETGDGSFLRRAAGLNYAKVFSVWTPVPTIYKILDTLRKA
jgi:tRNA A-37 threonylcarbamoyl transferase component Bud32/predicted nucleotidyltransferase